MGKNSKTAAKTSQQESHEEDLRISEEVITMSTTDNQKGPVAVKTSSVVTSIKEEYVTLESLNKNSKLLRKIYQILLIAFLYLMFKEFQDWIIHPGLTYRSHPITSSSEWMNVSAFDKFSPTSSGLKKMVYPRPIRGPKQLLVQVIKASGNPVDFKMRRDGAFPLKMLPAISGYDFSGIVKEVDADSPRFNIGDKVFGMLPMMNPFWGTFAEYVVIDEAHAASIPNGISFSEAAATPLVSLTALQALAFLGPVTPNETILIHAGSGGVGTFAIQFAKHLLKLRVYTTSSNIELCKSLGADFVINYKTEKFEKMEYDYVLDSIGGDYLIRGMPQIRKHYVSILNSGWHDYFGFAQAAVFEPLSWILFKLRYYGTLGMLYPKYDLVIVKASGTSLEHVAQYIKNGIIKVVLDEEFQGLDDGPRKVHDRIQAGKAKGKVVLSIASPDLTNKTT